MDPIYNKIMALAIQKRMQESKLSIEGQKFDIKQLKMNMKSTTKKLLAAGGGQHHQTKQLHRGKSEKSMSISNLSASQIMVELNSVKTSSCKSFDLVSNISIHDLKL